MLTMDQIHHIRELYYEQGITNLSELAQMTGKSWNTVKKYVEKEDFNTPKPQASDTDHQSKLTPFKELIDAWLETDKRSPRKQRHTAKKVFKRLSKETEGFNCSYRTVAAYVARRKKELRLTIKNEAYIPLLHRPGTAQADFGQADFLEHGRRMTGKYFVLSFPHSNGAYLQLNYGENLECLLEALRTIFEYIGGVPNEIWFDNASAIVTSIIKGGGRNVNERFQRFREHYRFKAVFMNPESGWEKGNVENKVGYSRRNLLVPIPEFELLTEFNKDLLKLCDEDMDREHYKDQKYISQLYAEDRAAFHQLPDKAFDTARYETLMADKYGKVHLDGKYVYSASPAVKESEVTLMITSSDVTVYDQSMNMITCHKRLYGDEERERMDWVPYLKYIARKPRSLRNSGIYDMMPANMQAYLDKCSNADRGSILKALAEFTDRDGIDNALLAVERAIDYSATDPDSLKALHNRLFSDVPQLPVLDPSVDTLLKNVIPFRSGDLSKLDQALVKGGACNG